MSKGRKKAKLRDLSREHPSREEIMELFEATKNAEPITTAIIGAILVEIELEEYLRRRLDRQTTEEWDSLIGENGPLGTFHRKILLGRALRLYDEAVAYNLSIVRNIRNAFAHAKRLIDFEHTLIVTELKSTKIPKIKKRAHREIKNLTHGPRSSYLALCHHLSMIILRRHTAALASSNRRIKKRANSMGTSYLSALQPFLSPSAGVAPPTINPLLLLLSSPGGQSGGPNTPTPLGSPSVLLRSLAKNDDKKGK